MQQQYQQCESGVKAQVAYTSQKHTHREEKAKFTIPTRITYSQAKHVILKTNCEKFVGIMNILHSLYK